MQMKNRQFAYRQWTGTHILNSVTIRTAFLTMALSLPQGVLALPVVVSQAGVVPGLILILLIGALNTATTAWTARATAGYFAHHGVVPSLSQLAEAQIGPLGGLLATSGGTALFFLALLASLVGLARSLAELSGIPAPIWSVVSGILLLLVMICGTTLRIGLLTSLGLLNTGLLILVIVLALPYVMLSPLPVVPEARARLASVGVTLMLFFTPMLVAPVAQQILPGVRDHRAFVRGSAAGVAGSAVLFSIWAVVICYTAHPVALAKVSGTALPALHAVVPAARLPCTLLDLFLLGMTALRCALVLGTLAAERLPAILGERSRKITALLPSGFGLALALMLLIDRSTSFTELIAIAGIGGAALTSLVVPSLLAWASTK